MIASAVQSGMLVQRKGFTDRTRVGEVVGTTQRWTMTLGNHTVVLVRWGAGAAVAEVNPSLLEPATGGEG
ncbi:hypothetical protein [Pseudonocardia oroxyli]|uniref:hypothetical protein n=1 Tax=Pseudonocardia oroxyli TaxID=366584 RepID=UPI000B888461|nr:hypothetical protein [Pseudonocardia oroxyli]